MSDEEIQTAIASVLDENGNYRSSLYQRHMVGGSVGANLGSMGPQVKDQYGNVIVQNVLPTDTGVLDIKQAKTQYLDLNTPLAKLKADEEARRALGSTPPSTTTQTAANPVSSTQFNRINPAPTSGLPSSTNPAPTVAKPITVPNSMISSAPSTASSTTTSSTNPTKTFKVLSNGNVQMVDPTTGITTQGTADYMKTLGYKA
jgi:hypothetical protein